MVPSTGYNKTRTAVFISGTGSNLKSLIQFSRTAKSPISIDFVISNNSRAKGLDYAKKFKIKKKVLNFKNKNLKKIDKFFSKQYKPYVIGKISENNKKVILNGSINWSQQN